MTARRHSAGEAEGKNQFCYSSSAEADATEQQISPIISVSPPCNGEQLIEPPEMRSLEAQFAGACKVVGGIIADASVELGENVSQDMLSPKESIQVSQNDHLELEAENAALRAELCAARRQIEEFIQSSAFAKEEIIKCSARNEALERKCAEHNDVISSSYAKLVAVVAELEDSRERLAAAEALTRSAADDAKIAQTRASESLLLFARSEALATEYMRQIDDLKAEASTGRAEYSVLELRLAEQERKSAIQQMKFASLEREMISKNAFADSLEARIRDYEGAIAILNRQISTLESDVHSRSVEVNVLRESEAALTRQSADMAASLTRIKARRNELRNLLDNERSESNELKNKLRSSENSIEELHSQIAGLVVSLEASRAEATAQRQLAVNLSQEVAKHKDVIMYINKISSESGRRNS
jgi:chromosome segregation ATPase